MLVEYIPSLIAAGLILVPVILWSDIFNAWFRNWFNGKKENQLLYLLAVTVGGAIILWLLSYLAKYKETGGVVVDFFASIFALIGLAVIFFVATTWANVIRNAIAGAITPGNNAKLWYVVAATVVPLIILSIMVSLGLLPQIGDKKTTGSLPGVTVTA